jgi:hypothetical protein
MIRRRRIFAATYWDLTECFFEAQRQYREIYILYETQVLAHAEEQLVDRRHLRLDAHEVSKLLDFDRLGNLRSGPLTRAKNISHSLFRKEGRTHKFDRYLSEIWHEVAILREEQFKVSTFADHYRLDNELAEYESILDEVHEDFPRRVHHLHELFKRAQRSLEGVLRARRNDPIYLRSFYMFGTGTVQDAYPDGVRGHAWRVFDAGPAEAYFKAARSFARKGFRDEALRALERAEDAVKEGPAPGSPATERHFGILGEEIASFRNLVHAATPSELVLRLQAEVVEPSHGDDAAPDLGEDWPSTDETSELEEALGGL